MNGTSDSPPPAPAIPGQRVAGDWRSPHPCADCGNTFVEIFGEDGKGFGKGWWCGCKRCSRRDPGKEHERGKTRDTAIDKWDAKNPLPPTTSGREGESE